MASPAVPGVFVSHSRPDPGVFESQVLEVGRLWSELGVDFRYLVFEGLRTAATAWRQIRREVDSLNQRFEVEMEVRHVPAPLSDLGLRRAATALVKRASRREGGRVLIQARGAVSACAALEARRRLPSLAVLYDARADPAAEARLVARHANTSKEALHWERRASRLEELQRRASAEADQILAVSTPLRDHLCQLSGIDPAKVTVIPCCVAVQRFRRPAQTRREMRRRLNLDDRFVFIYSGSLGTYQLPEKIAELAMRLKEYLPRFHLLVVTRDSETASIHFAPLIADRTCTIESCLQEQVADYLAAADAGILLRHNDPLNRVASPVKFAEYQVAGLPVVATPGIGEVSEYLRGTGYGLLLDLQGDVGDLARQVADWVDRAALPSRETISDAAISRFSRSSYRGAYLAVLRRLGFEAHLGSVTRECPERPGVGAC